MAKLKTEIGRAHKPKQAMRRRDFITLLGGAAALPVVARAQQRQMPVIGILDSGSARPTHDDAFLQGLRENGFVVGRNVAVEYRRAEGHYDRLPGLAAELVAMPAAVIVTHGTDAAVAAKKASHTTTPAIPVIFSFGGDPVAEGLVASLSRPGGNVTGFTSMAAEVGPKRLGLVRELTGVSAGVIFLINPRNRLAHMERRDTEAAARAVGQPLEILTASTVPEIEATFANLEQRRIGALIIAVDTLYFSQMGRMAALASRYRVPAIGPLREFAASGGLMSYGASIRDQRRQIAAYVARILNGVLPADLPVLQPTQFELVINLKAAKALGLEIPPTLLARADEVIE
jgi:putative tryptophan/tyrosine transport system substrate-binding protein